MSVLKRFIRDEAGTVALMLGLSLIPVAGLTGVAVDYGRAITLRSGLQKAADVAAMSALYAAHDGRAFDVQAAYRAALGPSAQALLGSGRDGSGQVQLAVTGTWITPGKEYKVTVNGTLGGTLVRAVLPGRMLDVGVVAAAVGSQTRTVARIQGANLDPEAGDYNETQAYCYNDRAKTRLGPLDPQTGTRKPFAKIADNTDAGVQAGPQITDVQCGEGEQVSFVLKNIRDARTNTALQRTGTPRYFYTDATVNSAGVLSYAVTFEGVTRNTLETILCDTKDQCRPRSKGGILPENHQTGRVPAVNTKVCSPGKYLYMGWEDRIPNYPGDNSDTDFDDIRMYVTCPSEVVGPFLVRLSA